jgi:hypothetical protein
MSFSVGLCPNFARKGGVTSRSLPATQSSDHDCKPEGDQANHVSGPERQASPERRNVAAEDVQGDLDEINHNDIRRQPDSLTT